MNSAEAPTLDRPDLHACFHAAQRALADHDDFCPACAEFVMLAVAFLQRSTLRHPTTARACAKICDELARKCGLHAGASAHCRQCAEACYACANECRRIAAGAQQSIAA